MDNHGQSLTIIQKERETKSRQMSSVTFTHRILVAGRGSVSAFLRVTFFHNYPAVRDSREKRDVRNGPNSC